MPWSLKWFLKKGVINNHKNDFKGLSYSVFQDDIDPNNIKVVVGAKNVLDKAEKYRQDIDINFIVKHPKYDSDPLSEKAYYDVAMVKLSKPIV